MNSPSSSSSASASGLDPLLKEAFCVARQQNVGTRERPNWVTKHEFQPSEAGMLARAERFPDFGGIQASAVYAEDEIVDRPGRGEVVHRFNPAKRKGALVGAWARVVRDGQAARRGVAGLRGLRRSRRRCGRRFPRR